MSRCNKLITVFSEIKKFSFQIDLIFSLGKDGVFLDLSWRLKFVCPQSSTVERGRFPFPLLMEKILVKLVRLVSSHL